MRLRKLEKKDAKLMLEWMHDNDVVAQLGANFKEKDINDCEGFIKNSEDTTNDLHLAIVDDDDVYMGTVSLKHIDMLEKDAEFAITVRSVAMGKGYSKYAMETIIDIGLKELGLNHIYWCVSVENVRAIRFYDKNEYRRVEKVPKRISDRYTEAQLTKFLWYVVTK